MLLNFFLIRPCLQTLKFCNPLFLSKVKSWENVFGKLSWSGTLRILRSPIFISGFCREFLCVDAFATPFGFPKRAFWRGLRVSRCQAMLLWQHAGLEGVKHHSKIIGMQSLDVLLSFSGVVDISLHRNTFRIVLVGRLRDRKKVEL